VVLVSHLIALGCYAVATAAALAPFAGLRPAPRAVTLGVPLTGVAAHVVGVAQVTPVGVAPALSLLALFLILLQVASERLFRASAVALFTGPLATGLIALALLIGLAPEAPGGLGGPAGATGPTGPPPNAWSILHVTVSILGLALLALAFIAAALYLVQFRELKTKRFGQVFRLFPPLERLDRLNHLALVLGFPTVTLGVLLGYGMRYAGGATVDPAQVVWGTLTWLVLGWAVGVRVVRHWVGRRAAFASIASFAAVLLVYLALKLSAPGTQRFL
jgi:ABC-type transport system involved in cytochrome c biogenesis permease subunit